MRDPFFLAKLRAFILGLRPRKIRRRLLERRARRLARRQRRALEVPTPSIFVLEPLEGRVLLSADFTGAVDLLNQPILPSEPPAVSVLLDTRTPQSASGPGLTSAAHAHHDDDRGPHAGFIGPSWSDWHFGEKHGPPESVTVHDADGARVTFTLTGPGREQIVRDGNTWDVVLTGTDARSTFTIKTRGGDGQAEVDDVRVDGSPALDDVHGGTVSEKSIGEISIQGDLDDDRLVQAGALPKYVEIDHHRIEPAHDPRFITHTRGHH